MVARPPAAGIEEIHDLGDSKGYRVSCACGDSAHSIHTAVEADDFGITVHTWATIEANHWAKVSGNPFLQWLLSRIKMTWELWVNGGIKFESWTIMNEQQAHNYATALTKAIEDVKTYKQKQ